MQVIQVLTDCVEICAHHGVEHVILCPGSRNAALIIAFEQHPAMQCFSISDERVAAFIAMGMAMETKKATAIVCTSGTAALNFTPGIAEAFFQEIPLIVLTADRPAEWIDQYDGQTVYQVNTYGKHVKANYNLLADYENPDVRWFANRVFNEALIQANQPPYGPVHINIPIREPFYPSSVTQQFPSKGLRLISPEPIIELISERAASELAKKIATRHSIWIVVGQQTDPKLNTLLEKIRKLHNILIISDILGNITSDIVTTDNLFSKENTLPKPDLLITCGKSIITKRLKLFLRAVHVSEHWHIQKSSAIRDPYQSISNYLNLSPTAFFSQVTAFLAPSSLNASTEIKNLVAYDKQLQGKINDYLQRIEFSDLGCVAHLTKLIPSGSILHLGNSMSVRYANAVNFLLNENIEVQCNRGTSGIEGSLSTAVGQAILTTRPVFCLLGDVSFLYDKNALWHNYPPLNLKIIVLNNGGGNIFRMIPGPKDQSSFGEFFETEQHFSAEKIAAHYGIDYFAVDSAVKFSEMTELLKSTNKTILIECFTEADTNERVYKNLLGIR